MNWAKAWKRKATTWRLDAYETGADYQRVGALWDAAEDRAELGEKVIGHLREDLNNVCTEQAALRAELTKANDALAGIRHSSECSEVQLRVAHEVEVAELRAELERVTRERDNVEEAWKHSGNYGTKMRAERAATLARVKVLEDVLARVLDRWRDEVNEGDGFPEADIPVYAEADAILQGTPAEAPRETEPCEHQKYSRKTGNAYLCSCKPAPEARAGGADKPPKLPINPTRQLGTFDQKWCKWGADLEDGHEVSAGGLRPAPERTFTEAQVRAAVEKADHAGESYLGNPFWLRKFFAALGMPDTAKGGRE
ncbi:MAG: hypothetical protein NVS3B25_09760 [Hymenobacter sp.]